MSDLELVYLQFHKAQVESQDELLNDLSKSMFLIPANFIQLQEDSQNKNFPLLWKAAVGHNFHQAQKLLAENDFSYDICSTLMDGNSILIYAVSLSHYSMVKALLKHPQLDLKK